MEELRYPFLLPGNHRWLLCKKKVAAISLSLMASAALLTMPAAMANMSVYPMEVTLDNQGAAQVQTLSKSDEAQFIKVTIKKIEHPATPAEKEVVVDNAMSRSLIATPEKFALASGSQRLIRLIALQLPEKETAWRVYFEAVGAPEELSDAGGAATKMSTQVGINLVWGVLVHIPPKIPAISVKKLVSGEVKNDGSLRMAIREVGLCPQKNMNCQWKKEHATVYPDEMLRLKSWSSAELNSAQEIRIKYVDQNTRNIKEYTLKN